MHVCCPAPQKEEASENGCESAPRMTSDRGVLLKEMSWGEAVCVMR